MSASLPRRAFLGAELPDDRDAFSGDGVLIAGARPDGMIDRAGIRGGDRVIELAGVRVTTLCELSAGLRRAGAAETTEIVYVRDGQRVVVVVDVDPHPREDGVEYGELAVAGARLRRLAVATSSPRAVVLVMQGIACESIDLATRSDAPLAGLVAGWARAGVDSLRVDKRGVGDSEGGPCEELDFATELADVRAALDDAAAVARRRRVPLIVFGHSVGGVMAARLVGDGALAAGVAGVAGVIVYGTPVMRWFDCLVDSIGRQLALRGASADDIERATRGLEDRARVGGLNGRSAAYHAQLHALDLEAIWRGVAAPVLVLRGEHDWVVRPDDQARIAELAPRGATIVDLPGLDHLFAWHADREASLRDYGDGRFDPLIVDATLGWIDRLCSAT
jgi:alpha-beta hydrolase superfamily lysophospholipase